MLRRFGPVLRIYLSVVVAATLAIKVAEAIAAGDQFATRQESAFHLPAARRLASWTIVKAGDFGTLFDRQGDGLQLVSLFDLAKHRQLLTAKPTPLFTVTMRQMESKEEVSLRADAGWEQVQAKAATPVELRWQTPKDKRLGGLRVTVLGSLDEAAGAMRWKLTIDQVPKPWCVRRVMFPQLALDAANPQFELFYPKGPGQVKRAPWPPSSSTEACIPKAGSPCSSWPRTTSSRARACTTPCTIRWAASRIFTSPGSRPIRPCCSVTMSGAEYGCGGQWLRVIGRGRVAGVAGRLVRCGHDLPHLGAAQCIVVSPAHARRPGRHAALDAEPAALGAG